jgi:ABC-2 type transport system permease protein
MIGSSLAFSRFVLHDLRLSARGFASMFGPARPATVWALLVLLLAGLHAAAWPVAGWLLGVEEGPGGAARLGAGLGAGVVLVLPWMTAQSMTALTRMLFDRSDLELILSSPVGPRSFLAARVLSIAVDSVATVGVLLLPLADVAALRAHGHWLALYPALIAAGLLGTGLGVTLGMGLCLAMGPRRARLISQIAATAVGASFVLGGQVVAMLPAPMRSVILGALAPSDSSALHALIGTPVRAAEGDPAAILGFTVAGLAAFAAACALFGERFAEAALVAAGTPASGASAANRAVRFGRSVGAALRTKERRVVWRDPWLVSQLVLQAAYTMPVAVILWRHGGPTGSVGVAFTPALVVIAAQLAGALSWIALSAEDAPDFLATAPLSRRAVEQGKIAAIAQPIAVILAVPLAALSLASPWAGACALVFGAGAIASAALVNLWRQTPSRRSLVLRRHAQSKLVGLMEHLVSILWAVAAAIAVIGSWKAIVPVAGVAGALAVNWRFSAAGARGRSTGRLLGE